MEHWQNGELPPLGPGDGGFENWQNGELPALGATTESGNGSLVSLSTLLAVAGLQFASPPVPIAIEMDALSASASLEDAQSHVGNQVYVTQFGVLVEFAGEPIVALTQFGTLAEFSPFSEARITQFGILAELEGAPQSAMDALAAEARLTSVAISLGGSLIVALETLGTVAGLQKLRVRRGISTLAQRRTYLPTLIRRRRV